MAIHFDRFHTNSSRPGLTCLTSINDPALVASLIALLFSLAVEFGSVVAPAMVSSGKRRAHRKPVPVRRATKYMPATGIASKAKEVRPCLVLCPGMNQQHGALSLSQAKDFAEDWYLELRGKKRRGELHNEKTFQDAAGQFIREYEVITEGQRSPKWVEGHKARIRLYHH